MSPQYKCSHSISQHIVLAHFMMNPYHTVIHTFFTTCQVLWTFLSPWFEPGATIQTETMTQWKWHHVKFDRRYCHVSELNWSEQSFITNTSPFNFSFNHSIVFLLDLCSVPNWQWIVYIKMDCLYLHIHCSPCIIHTILNWWYALSK